MKLPRLCCPRHRQVLMSRTAEATRLLQLQLVSSMAAEHAHGPSWQPPALSKAARAVSRRTHPTEAAAAPARRKPAAAYLAVVEPVVPGDRAEVDVQSAEHLWRSLVKSHSRPVPILTAVESTRSTQASVVCTSESSRAAAAFVRAGAQDVASAACSSRSAGTPAPQPVGGCAPANAGGAPAA